MPLEKIGNLEILKLTGCPEEMGFEHGSLLKERVNHAIENYLHKSEEIFDVPYPYLVEKARHCAVFIPAEYMDEMRALAGGAEVAFDDIVALNCLADVDGCYMEQIFQCCNFVFSSPASKEGLFLHGRNLDFPPADCVIPRASMLISRFDPHVGPIPTLTVGFAGFVGMFSGCSAAQLAIGEVSTPAKDASLDGIPMQILMRRSLEKGENLKDAVKVLAEGPRTCGYNLAISDGKSHSSCCVETTHTLCERRNSRRGVLVVDDVCFCKQTGRGRLTYPAGAFRYARMTQLAQEHYGAIDVNTALAFLGDRHDMSTGKGNGVGYNCLCNSHTVHSVLFLPAEERLYVSHGSVPAPEGIYQEILVRNLWKRI